MSKTRELDSPRSEVEGGSVEWHENHYKLSKEEVGGDLELEVDQFHDRYCECFDCIPPITPLEKAQHPFKRKYPDKDLFNK